MIMHTQGLSYAKTILSRQTNYIHTWKATPRDSLSNTLDIHKAQGGSMASGLKLIF